MLLSSVAVPNTRMGPVMDFFLYSRDFFIVLDLNRCPSIYEFSIEFGLSISYATRAPTLAC